MQTAPHRQTLDWSNAILIVVALSFVMGARSRLAQPEDPAFDPTRVLTDIRILSDPRCEGRGVGTAGIERATDYLVHEFQSLGVTPLRTESLRDPFPVTVGQELLPGCKASSDARQLAQGRDWAPLVMGSPGNHSGLVVFVGHGISAPELKHDDYTHQNVAGSWVVVLEHEPGENDPKSPFRKPEAYRHRDLRTKAINAREHGAKGLVFVRDGLHDLKPGESELLPFDTNTPTSPAGLMMIQVTRAVADAWKKAGKVTLDVTVNMHQRRDEAANVVAVLPGTGPKRLGSIVIGAHYDHLGWGGINSLAPGEHVIHPGADDNASGTAGVLALARRWAARGRQRRTLVFALFSGEEMGLLGSSHLAKTWPSEVAAPAAMINMDMVGRSKDGRLYIHGTETALEWKAMLEGATALSPLTPRTSGDGYGPSDHTSFYAKGVPVLFFFTGAHVDYHRPTDTYDRIQLAPMISTLKVVDHLVNRLARGEAVTVVKALKAPPSHGARGSGGGYGAYFGAIPDMSDESVDGVLLTGVRAGSPGEKAGVKAGDVIIKFGTLAVKNLYDMTYALQKYRSGDTVEVTVKRAGRPLTVSATLGTRGK